QIVRFPRVSTIDDVYRPVERFLERLGGTDAGREALPRLDAYLLHLILEFCPRPVVVSDLAYGFRTGTTSVVCLSSLGVSRVFAAIESAAAPASKSTLLSVLEGIAGERGNTSGRAFVPLEPNELAWQTIRAESPAHELPLFLIEPSGGEVDLDRDLGTILEEHPQALILVLSAGRLGECGTAQALG